MNLSLNPYIFIIFTIASTKVLANGPGFYWDPEPKIFDVLRLYSDMTVMTWTASRQYATEPRER